MVARGCRDGSSGRQIPSRCKSKETKSMSARVRGLSQLVYGLDREVQCEDDYHYFHEVV